MNILKTIIDYSPLFLRSTQGLLPCRKLCSVMSTPKRGILLVNLGTPSAPTASAVREFLAEFLSDIRVIDLSRALWNPILYGMILPFRSPKVAKHYESIWTEDGSPLLAYSLRQKAKLAERLPGVPVELGMSYGTPSLAGALDSLLGQGVKDLTVLPLYPQYSSTTTAPVYDGISRLFASMKTIPSLNFVRSYATHPAYIQALGKSIQASFATHGEPDRLIFSYHGIPQRYADTGDIYPQECTATTQKVAEFLKLPEEKFMTTYQSRFGYETWLTPYTEETLKQLPSEDVKHVQIICPGFAVDCLETLEEIRDHAKEFFLDNGGEKYHYIPALNDSDDGIELLQAIVG